MFRKCLASVLSMALVLLPALALTACGTTKPVRKFTEGKRVDIHRGFSDMPIWQNGSPVYEGGFVNAVLENESAQSHLANATLFSSIGLISATVGGGFIGASFSSDNHGRDLYIGVGLMLVAIGSGSLANNQLAKAAEDYNKSLTKAYVSPVRDGALAGVQISY